MRHDLTAVVCIVDKSGSMQPLINDTIGGFNRFIDEQRGVPGDVWLTLVFFNGDYQVALRGKTLADLEPLSVETYRPEGSTALLDAIGRTITEVGQDLSAMEEAQRPGKVVVAILTDGEENSSRLFSREQVAHMIAHQRDIYQWEFLFLSASEKFLEEAASLNIPAYAAGNYVPDARGTTMAFESISSIVTSNRFANAAQGYDSSELVIQGESN